MHFRLIAVSKLHVVNDWLCEYVYLKVVRGWVLSDVSSLTVMTADMKGIGHCGQLQQCWLE